MLSTQFYERILLLYHLVLAVTMIDIYSYSNPLIAGIIVFILIRMLNAAEALYRHVNESESCSNLQPVKLLNYLQY